MGKRRLFVPHSAFRLPRSEFRVPLFSPPSFRSVILSTLRGGTPEESWRELGTPILRGKSVRGTRRMTVSPPCREVPSGWRAERMVLLPRSEFRGLVPPRQPPK